MDLTTSTTVVYTYSSKKKGRESGERERVMTKETKAAEYELITPIGETADEARNLPIGSLVKLIFGSLTGCDKK